MEELTPCVMMGCVKPCTEMTMVTVATQAGQYSDMCFILLLVSGAIVCREVRSQAITRPADSRCTQATFNMALSQDRVLYATHTNQSYMDSEI